MNNGITIAPRRRGKLQGCQAAARPGRWTAPRLRGRGYTPLRALAEGLDLANGDGAVSEMRMILGALHGFGVAGSFDDVVAAEEFFGFAEGAVGDARLAGLGTEDAARLVAELVAADQEAGLARLVAPVDIGLHGPLDLVWRQAAELLDGCRVVIEQKQILRHGGSFRSALGSPSGSWRLG